MSCSRPEATRPAALWLALTHGIQGKRLSEAAFDSQHSARFAGAFNKHQIAPVRRKPETNTP